MRFPSLPFSRKRSTAELQSPASSSSSSRKSSAATTPEALEEVSFGLGVKINKVANNLNMASSTSSTAVTPTPSPPLSLFVLLPASAHSHHVASPHAPSPRPSPLVSRQSGSTVQTLKSMSTTKTEEPVSMEKVDTPEIDKVVVAGRRMSLAPGIGSGTQTRSDGSKYAITPSMISFDLPLDESPRRESKPFGSRSLLPSAGGRRRPQTAATAATPLSNPISGNHALHARGSIAVPSGGGLLNVGGGVGKTRPGWEGDEVVGVLRGSGLEVTVIRHASQLPTILSSSSSSPSFGSYTKPSSTPRLDAPVSVTPVILVPLSDSPTIPSLSLLLQQGTTPTAVCFQQDLLDRAKRSEDEWLPAALQQIRTVSDMRDQIMAATSEKSKANGKPETPVVLAYSANPAISSSTIASCVNAGASGVLKPPYDLETARYLRRMIRAARDGRISSLVGLPNQASGSPSQLSAVGMTPTVVLPPTALNAGGEYQSEKVLAGATGSQRRLSDLRESRQSISEGPNETRRKGSIHHLPVPGSTSPQNILGPSPTRNATFQPSTHHEEQLYLESLHVYNPAVQQRRRSVDSSGLAIALQRAQRAFEGAPIIKARTKEQFVTPGFKHSTQSDNNGERTEEDIEEDDGHDTQLAELLSAMFYQSQKTIDIQMTEFERFSSPISKAHHHRIVDSLSTWDFKPHNLDDGDLFRAACILFDGLLNSQGLVELQLDRGQLHRLLFAIRAIYHAPNPYHNYVHAIDVLQATYSFLVAIGVAPPFSYLKDLPNKPAPWRRPEESMNPSHGPGSRRARHVFRPQDVLAIVVAAMGHDVGHPGLSNAFMKNAKTPLSQVYDDRSVLENMHCMLIIRLLRKHGLDFLINPPREGINAIPARAAFDSAGFRQILYSSILATDMSLHFSWMQDLQNFGEKISQESGVYAKNEFGPGTATDDMAEADRIMLAQAVIKCADISNPTRPIDVSEYWSSVLLKEWAVQASLETDLELPVSVIASADAALQAKGQIGFIKLFTQPLYDAVSDVLPELQCYADWCEENHGQWEARAEHLRSQAGTAIVQPVLTDAALDDRFATLFPLSLPVSLVTSRHLEPGPIASAAARALPVHHMKPSEGFMVHADSPSAKAMRAVYHANLLDQRHRSSRWTRGVPIPGVSPDSSYFMARRSSTPGLAYPSSQSPIST